MENNDCVFNITKINDKYIIDLPSDLVSQDTIMITKQYNIDGEYGIGYTSNTHKEFYFDLEDFELINRYRWYEYINPKTGYHSLRARERGSRKTVLMTALLGCKFYDHIDRNPLNCRRDNLRPATQQENTCNRTKMKNNTSGVTGVTWNKKDGVWVATIGVDYERIHLGTFNDKTKAIIARLTAEKQYFGNFAPQKHLYEIYNIT